MGVDGKQFLIDYWLWEPDSLTGARHRNDFCVMGRDIILPSRIKDSSRPDLTCTEFLPSAPDTSSALVGNNSSEKNVRHKRCQFPLAAE